MRLPLSIVLIIAIAIAIVFAVPNRELVTLRFWPLDYEIQLPLYLVAFVAMFLGFFLGWIGSWFAQRKWRKLARDRARRIEHLENEVIQLADAAKTEAAKMNPATAGVADETKIPTLTLRR